MDSNFYLQSKSKHRFDEFDVSSFSDFSIKVLLETYIENMNEVRALVGSSFKLILHAELREQANRLYDREKMLSYADGLEHGYSSDSERINREASEKVKAVIKDQDLNDTQILENVVATLNMLENDDAIKRSNFATLRQSIVAIWSATESLIRDLVAFELNNNCDKAKEFFESDITNPYWTKKSISYDFISNFGFNLSDCLGDIALEINSCNGIGPIRKALSFLYGEESEIYKIVKSSDFYKLYKLRNLIAHRNGVVDERYLSEVGCVENVGDRIVVFPDRFSECFLTSKALATAVYVLLSSDLGNDPYQ